MFQNNRNNGMAALGSSDEDLARLAQQGSVDAFTTLYERYLPLVYKRVRYTIPERDVEDITQDIFIAVMRSLKGYKGNALFSTWLRTLTKRRIADYYRRDDKGKANLDVDLSDADQLIPDKVAGSGISKMDDQIILRKALCALPEDYQDILHLRFGEGLQFNEIARLRGQSLEAVKSLFRRAVSALRKQMGVPDA